jgi:hypothetical protein
MTYNDPSFLLSQDDALLPEVESKIQDTKKTVAAEIIKGKSYIPRGSLRFVLRNIKSGEEFRLSGYRDSEDKIRLDLYDSLSLLIRKGHFNDTGHHNPNGRDIPPPNHIHFPTQSSPDLHKHHGTYAYQVISKTDYLSALKKYCQETNIELESINISLYNGLGQ